MFTDRVISHLKLLELQFVLDSNSMKIQDSGSVS